MLRRFLGVERWQSLIQALKRESAVDAKPDCSSLAVWGALLVSVTPLMITFAFQNSSPDDVHLPTVAFGISSVLAIWIRWRLQIDFNKVVNWREAIGLTHTAFALGCIPAVIVIALSPEMLSMRHDVVSNLVSPIKHSEETASAIQLLQALGFVACLALWVAVTEEFIFRGLLIGVVRRWKLLPTQLQRDLLAGCLSSVLFGIAHYPTWGLGAAIALAGLGAGLALGYLANGERLTPLILYHFLFDILSILLGLFFG